jgi:hypothetical protein
LGAKAPTVQIFQASGSGTYTTAVNATVISIEMVGAGGGGGGGTTLYAGTATVNFGSAGGNVATVAVTGQTWVTATSHVDAFLMGTDSTADHNADEHGIVNMTTRIISLTAGTGFTIQAYSEWTLTGTFKLHWRGF